MYLRTGKGEAYTWSMAAYHAVRCEHKNLDPRDQHHRDTFERIVTVCIERGAVDVLSWICKNEVLSRFVPYFRYYFKRGPVRGYRELIRVLDEFELVEPGKKEEDEEEEDDDDIFMDIVY